MHTIYQQQAKLKLITTVVALVVIAGVVMVIDNLKPKTASVSSSQTQTANTPSTSPTNSSATSSASSNTTGSSYKDGTYTASASYFVPHANETIQVSLTLKNGTITTVSIQNSEGDPTSASYQESFASAYKSSVVGQKISGLQISTVAGASDTTQGFDDALSQITSKAQA